MPETKDNNNNNNNIIISNEREGSSSNINNNNIQLRSLPSENQGSSSCHDDNDNDNNDNDNNDNDNDNDNDERHIPNMHDGDSIFIIDNANVILQSDSQAQVEIDIINSDLDTKDNESSSSSSSSSNSSSSNSSFESSSGNINSTHRIGEQHHVVDTVDNPNKSSSNKTTKLDNNVIQIDDSNMTTILQCDSKAQVELVGMIQMNVSIDVTASCNAEGNSFDIEEEEEETGRLKKDNKGEKDILHTKNSSSSSSNFTKRWSNFIYKIQKPIENILVNMSMIAAKYPYKFVILSITLAILLSIIGLLTNFTIENREAELWSPKGSLPDKHRDFVDKEFGNIILETEEDGTHYCLILIHANGDNVITYDGIKRTFDMVNSVRDTTDGYTDFCSIYGTTYPCPTTNKYNADALCKLFGIPTINTTKVCKILGPTAYWLHNTTVFNTYVANDNDVQNVLSINTLPGQKEKIDITNFIGYPEYNNNGTLIYAKSLSTYFSFPRNNDNNNKAAEQIERDVTKRILELQKIWDNDINNPYKIEIIATRSFEDEFNRGINNDMILLPIVGILMSSFTFIVFWRYDWLYSRSTLGLGATVCVTISIMTGYGILFCIGIPFTSLSQAAILIIYGVGLDDSFIIFNAYERNDHIVDTIERLRYTMKDVSVSIFMTTATSVCAFIIGCFSTVPAIRWLCIYASCTIAIDFIYQITFFISLIVLDEVRIANRRRDVLIWLKVPDVGYYDNERQEQQNTRRQVGDRQDEIESNQEGNTSRPHISVRVMTVYADILLKPVVKAVVLAIFVSLLGYLAHRATMLELKFSFTNVIPKDSYITRFTEAMLDYSERRGANPLVYFRYVDQSKPEIRSQMEDYVNDLVGIDSITKQPFHFWVRDYDVYVEENKEFLDGLAFNETLWFFLRDFEKDYTSSFVLDDNFQILYSRTQLHMDKVSIVDTDSILNAHAQQKEVTKQQPVNQGGGDQKFFAFDPIFQLWEFIAITEDEIVKSTISGMVAVSIMSVLFLPHWSGILFVAPLMAVLYTDLLGVLHIAGIYVNGLTYVCMVLSIGLLVDFLMHVALRYFESSESGRNAKVKEVLQTMGASVLLGGLSTFLGILPLILSSSEVIYTVFVTFVGIVTLGLGHGLILLPVILSLVGPI